MSRSATKRNRILDVAIVGGGVSGVYSGWRLLTGSTGPGKEKKGSTPKHVAIFEASERIGGRLLSVTPPGMPHVPCELGGMRYESIHTLVRSLVENVLKLPIVQLQVSEPGNFAYMRGVHLRQSEFADSSAVPYHLRWAEQNQTPGQLFTTYALNQIVPNATTMTPAQLVQAVRTAEFDGRPLYKQGFWNVLMRVLSAEAYNFGIDGLGYDSLAANWNAADAMPFMLADFAPTVTYWKLSGGYEEVPLQLTKQFTDAGGELHLDAALQSFDTAKLPDGTSGVVLRFGGARGDVYARKIILALPPRSLELLAPTGPLLDPANTEFPKLMNAVDRIPLFKLFLCYHTPWWQTVGVTTGRSLTDLPIRQTYYWGVEGQQPGADPTNQNSALLASYNDMRYVDYWSGLRKSSETSYARRPNPHTAKSRGSADWGDYKAPHDLVMEAHRQLVEMHGVIDAPLPYDAAYRDWMDDPYGAGVHFWSIHEKSWEVIPKVIHPMPKLPIYVCNEAWSAQQGWVEGSLQTAELLLEKHFNLVPPPWVTPEPDMSALSPVGICGYGYAVPAGVRTNHDPIFDWLHKNQPDGTDLFQGYVERRVLAPDEKLEDLLTVAARQALTSAGSDGSDIDLLLGVGTLSEYSVPSNLAAVHMALGLPSSTLIAPVHNEFNNFNTSVLFADAMIRCGHSTKALVVCGGDWTRAVDYHTPQAISVGDGAGAVVMAAATAPSQFRLLDSLTLVNSSEYGGMYLSAEEVSDTAPRKGLMGGTYSKPYFSILPKGMTGFRTFGGQVPQQVVGTLLARNGVLSSQITLVTHQASTVLMNAWAAAIKPAAYLSTITTFGNLTVSNIPATLASQINQVSTEYLVLVGIGVEMQTNALLLQRQSAT